MDEVITVTGLRKTYRSLVAVDGVSFSVRRGEIFGLLGPNGAGKTTLVECLQGLRRPDAGRLRVLDLDPVTQAAELRRRIGSQLQESALPDRIKVWEALDLFAASDTATDWRQLMVQWGLADKADAKVGTLSGGQRQRLFVALALLNRPEVVFLDEMTTGLDPAARRVAWDLIAAIRDHGATVVLVTHFMDEAERLCDRLAVIDAGRIVDIGSPRELVARHGGQVRLRFTAPDGALPDLRRLPHVREVRRYGTRVEVDGDGLVVPLVCAELVSHGVVPDDLDVHQQTLEDVFLTLTGHPARGVEPRREKVA